MNVTELKVRIPDPRADLGIKPNESADTCSTPATAAETPSPRFVTTKLSTNEYPTREFDFHHRPTASSNGLNYRSPMKPTEPNMKFNLGNGTLEKNTAADTEKENYSSSERKSLNCGKMSKSSSSRSAFPSSGSNRKSVSSISKNKLLSNNLRKHDPSSYKIFLLLLQPKLKTFELIQLIYSPNDTTIGDIIAMIPDNATEPALGSQTYNGLCRPKTEEEIVDHELLASEPRANTGVESANITLGEILVAIPEGYHGSDVAVLAKQILSNPKIVKLLKRSDPLAPKKSRRSSKRGLRKGSRRSRSKEHVEVMEKFDEEDEIQQEQEKKEQEKRMKKAMEHAARRAADSNAQIPGSSAPDFHKTINLPRNSSHASLDGSIEEEKSTESSLQESIDESYSSWSKSFDASFASTVASGVSKRSVRRRDRHSRRMKIIQRSVGAGFVIMLAMYFFDPHGYGRSDEEKVSQEATTKNPMGLSGILQCLFLLVSLYQVELFVRTTTASSSQDENGNGKSSFLQYLQNTRAMKKLKARFSKKLKRPKTRTRRGAVGAYDYDENTLTQKLRSFSLKNSNSTRSLNIDDSDTGSL